MRELVNHSLENLRRRDRLGDDKGEKEPGCEGGEKVKEYVNQG